uniref:Retrovirus-related Pol polyprotein from transposon TNT 1-94 n=1 Tax=Nelumbo nucifera TaxID=4432 RepID=A0A822YCQ0_NELNU|nr:TPA_asm: hypothetical protein HUJ06_010755 [Nelumbo nucifera]
MNGGSGASQMTIEKLVGTNYQYWRFCMEAYLQGQDLWDLVTGNDTLHDDTPQLVDARRKWKIKSGKALFALRTSINKEYIDHVRKLDSPKKIWDTLERLFTQKNTMRLQYLENELASLTQCNMFISDYFLKVKNVCAKISELDSEEPISDARLRRYLIRALRKEFMPFISSIQGWMNQPSIVELENLLSNQEALVKQMSGKFPNVEDALFVKDKSKTRNAHKHSSSDGKQQKAEGEQSSTSKLTCYRCGKVGHIKANFRVKIVCKKCDKPGHIKPNCRVKLAESDASIAHEAKEEDESNWDKCLSIEVIDQPDNIASAMYQNDPSAGSCIDYEKEWIVDSGYTHHATGDTTLLSDVPKNSNGEDLTLEYVYQVPGLKKNLASVSQITDSEEFVLFGPDKVWILKNLRCIDADVLFIGRKKNSLYMLSASGAYVDRTSQNTSVSLWHARLGHVGYQLLQQISTNRLLKGVPLFNLERSGGVCASCQYDKSHRLPFQKSMNHASSMFQLIHYDLMGPTSTPSYNGLCYMMVVVDDFSRYSWVYFLENKSEVLTHFTQFKMMVEKEFKFLSHEFLRFFEEHGIKRQFTCPNTPQQNGVAERKLAHLTAVTLSWLHDKNLPRELWAEAMQCACHVIIRLPPWLGTSKSHFELLFNTKPDVSYFKIFGSLCYVHVTKHSRAKLDPKARKCLFVGYDTHRKRWRCMDPVSKKIVTSHDVIFYEVSIFYPSSAQGENSEFVALTDSNLESPLTEVSSSERGSLESISQNDPPQGEVNQGTALAYFMMEDTLENEPISYLEAQGKPEWEIAMRDEIAALMKNSTWDLVPKPNDVDVITCKWYDLDYDDTFSPVAKMVTVRTIISLAASKDWTLWQFDVKNAFLYGELDHDIYMEQPQGFVSEKFPEHVCRLKKALYGLKQAPRAWYGKIAEYFKFCGFYPSNSDPSLFVKVKASLSIMILLYVHDMIVTGGDTTEIMRLQEDLFVRFEIKSLGEAHYGYFLSQKGYAAKILKRFGLEKSNSITTPMDPGLKLQKDEGEFLHDVTEYRRMFMERPCVGHMAAAKRILRYVKGTLNYGLLYQHKGIFSMQGYVDVDWAGNVNDRRSTTSYCFNIGSVVISWCSKKQATVALSSTEAEYVAATLVSQECIWLTRLLQDVNEASKFPIPIFCDNESAIRLAENPLFHARTKHIAVHYHFIRDKVLNQEIELLAIRTTEQVADGFTKALSRAKFEEFRRKLGLDQGNALRGSVTS